jgi:hypothetical protein
MSDEHATAVDEAMTASGNINHIYLVYSYYNRSFLSEPMQTNVESDATPKHVEATNGTDVAKVCVQDRHV